MTDLEAFRGMLDRAGIKYEETEPVPGVHMGDAPTDELVSLLIEQSGNPTVLGYSGFFCEMFFRKNDGSLWGTAAWE
jgi:hypothetical protein